MEHIKIEITGNSEEVRNSLHGLINNKRFADPLLPPLELSYTLISSETDSNIDYKLTSLGKMALACTCMAFTHRTDECKHIRRANGRS